MRQRQGEEGEADGGMLKGTQATCEGWNVDRKKIRNKKTQNRNKHQIIFKIQASKTQTINIDATVQKKSWRMQSRKRGREGEGAVSTRQDSRRL